MTQQIINIGTAANSKNGDPLRTAFTKVNANFAELYAAVAADLALPDQTGNAGKFLRTNGTTLSWVTGVGAGAISTTGDTPPSVPSEGDFWYDAVGGRTYISYNSAWVDTSPTPGTGNEIVNGSYSVSVGSDGTLTIPSAIYSPDELRVRIDGANDWIFYNGYLTLSNGAVLDDNARLGPAGLNILTLIDPSGYNTWNFGRDGNLTLPVGGAILDSTGTNILDGLSGGGITISDFGEGFSVTASNKIVTQKLYSTNDTQPTQHYRLELDNNGVVHLPDQSIINGATLKSVAGNYAGITAGAVGADEDSWVWVDSTGVYIATKYNTGPTKQWTFDNDGKLKLPVGGSIVDSNGINILSSVTLSGVESSFGIALSNFAAEAGKRYGVDTRLGPVVAVLPASPTLGDAIFFADAGNAYSSNNFTLERNGNTIMGATDNTVISTNGTSIGVFWAGNTWRYYA